MLASWKENSQKPRQFMKKQRHQFACKGPYSQSYSFSGSHIQAWELVHKKGCGPKNWCLWIVVLEKTLESPLDRKEIKPVNLKGNEHFSVSHFSHSVLSDSLWPHRLQHARPPCPSPTPGAYSNSGPLNQWSALKIHQWWGPFPLKLWVNWSGNSSRYKKTMLTR